MAVVALSSFISLVGYVHLAFEGTGPDPTAAIAALQGGEHATWVDVVYAVVPAFNIVAVFLLTGRAVRQEKATKEVGRRASSAELKAEAAHRKADQANGD